MRELLVLMPIYDDWESAGIVLRRLDEVLAERADLHVRALLLDDGSHHHPAQTGELAVPGASIRALRVLHLRRNLGHQRAIAVGLTYAHEQTDCDLVLVMDADGEDRPEDVPRLLDALAEREDEPIVFAARARRVRGLGFSLGYLGYRVLHRVLVGFMTRVGNFSLVPRSQLARLTVCSELWGHYAAAVFKARLPCLTVEADRGRRLRGNSRMGALSLVVHGLRAIAVFGERVAVRTLTATFAAGLAVLAALGVVLGIQPALPLEWVLGSAAFALILLCQLGASAALLAFLTLTARQGSAFLPARDYSFFVAGVDELAIETVSAERVSSEPSPAQAG